LLLAGSLQEEAADGNASPRASPSVLDRRSLQRV